MNLMTWSEAVKTRRKEVNLYADPVFKFLIQFALFVKLLVERFGGVHVEIIEYRNREPDPLTMDGKRNMMDAVVRINQYMLVDIEMQAYKKETDVRRFSHYSDLLNILRTKRGNTYSAEASMVLLLSKYRIREDGKESRKPILKRFYDGTVFYDKDVIVPVEFVHLKHLWNRPINELTPKDRLLLWMEFSNDERYTEQMNEIYKMDEELKEMEIIVRQSCMDDAMYFKLRDEADEYFREQEKEIQEKKLAQQQEMLEELDRKRKEEMKKYKLEMQKRKEEVRKRKVEAKKRKEEIQKRKELEQERKEERKMAVYKMMEKGLSEEDICEVLHMSKQEYHYIMKKNC